MLPPAPVLFSTMIGFPSRSCSRIASMRATTSPPPPAAKGTTNLIGLLGYFCCADATGTVDAAASASPDWMKTHLRMVSSSGRGHYAAPPAGRCNATPIPDVAFRLHVHRHPADG